MAKLIPFLGIFCGYIIVTFLTDTIEGRGILQQGNYDRQLKNENDSGKIRLRRRDERSLSAHIKVSRCKKQGCRVPIEALLRRHRHRHGMPAVAPKPTTKAPHTTRKKKSRHHDKQLRETSHKPDKTRVSRRQKKKKPDEALNEGDRKLEHDKNNKKHRKASEDHKKHSKKQNRGKNKRKSLKKLKGQTKLRIAPEDVMQTGEGGKYHPDLELDISLDPEEIMQNGEGLPASRYDIASYDQYYAGYGRRRFGRLQRPPEADRLERRLNPNVATAAHHLLSSMDRVVMALKDRIQTMHDNYDYVFNGTRFTMMNGVREELKKIAQTNDKVYDVVLDISLLTKDIYMRAHRRGLTRPTTRQRDMPTFASLSEALNTTYHAQMESKRQRNEVQYMLDECQRQTSYLQQIEDTLKENTNRRELIDLTRQVNMTVRKLRAEFDTAMVVRKLDRYMFVSGGSTQEDIREATMFLEDARLALRQAALNSRGNFVAHQDWKRRKSGEDLSLAPVALTDPRSRPNHRTTHRTDSLISAEEKKRLRPIIKRAVKHAQQLRQLADRIVRDLSPVLTSANRIISGGNGHVSHRVQASLLADKLITDIQKIRIALDRIRIVIYSEDDLKVRCEELAEGSGYDDETSPIDCDDFLETGSANGTDADVITSLDADEESDLYFDGEKVPETTTQSVAKRFGDKLNIHLIQLKKTGEQILVRAQTASNKTSEMSQRWNRITVNLGVGARFVTESSEYISDWNREQPNFDQIGEKIKAVNEKVDFVYNITQAKTLQAVLKAEKKLREVRGQKGEGSTRSDDSSSGGNSDQDFAAAIQATNKAKNTTSAILTFNSRVPSLVAGMDERMNEIRDKISSLREKVNKARLVMASFQVSINKTDDGYIPLTLTSSDGSHSMQTSIELCIKPEVTDGHVLLVTGNQANSYSLSMSSKKLTVTVYDAEGDDIGYVTSNIEVGAGKWYSVLVQRTGRNVSLSVRAEEETEAKVIGDIIDVDYTQSTPLSAYIGGAPKSLPMTLEPDGWKGCLGGLRVNGWSVGLLQKSSEGIVPLPCTSHCSPAPTVSSMVFEGAGYLHYPVGTVQLRYPTRSVYFEFRTRQENAFLISVVKRGFHLRVQLEDGTLLVETTTPSEAVVLRSQNSKYNDGVFHTLKIAYRDSTTYPEIDGKDGVFSIEDPSPVHNQSPVQGIVIGGMMNEHQHTMGSKFRPLIGCMRKLQINDVTMTMAEVADAEGVHVGSCSNSNMWLGCVEFANSSLPIDYGTTEEAKTVIIAVTRGSIGPVLHYQKGDKFNAVVSMKQNEINIHEYEDDFNGQLALKEDDNNSFVVIKITDASSTVTFEYMDKQASFSYTSGGGWFTAAEDVPYTIMVGGQEEETDMPPFQGGIAQLLVGNRYVDMSKYIDDNKLTACSRRFDPSPMTTDTAPLASRRR